MNARVNPFADLSTPLPSFAVKPRKQQILAEETITRMAEENNFPSRQGPRAREARRKRRLYTTGRNRQFNLKATDRTIERFQKMADERNVAQCVLLEQALDALERAGDTR